MLGIFGKKNKSNQSREEVRVEIIKGFMRVISETNGMTIYDESVLPSSKDDIILAFVELMSGVDDQGTIDQIGATMIHVANFQKGVGKKPISFISDTEKYNYFNRFIQEDEQRILAIIKRFHRGR